MGAFGGKLMEQEEVGFFLLLAPQKTFKNKKVLCEMSEFGCRLDLLLRAHHI